MSDNPLARPLRISDVARLVGRSPSYIRQLEREGVIQPAQRDRAGQRRFSEREAAVITAVLVHLTRSNERRRAHPPEPAGERQRQSSLSWPEVCAGAAAHVTSPSPRHESARCVDDTLPRAVAGDENMAARYRRRDRYLTFRSAL